MNLFLRKGWRLCALAFVVIYLLGGKFLSLGIVGLFFLGFTLLDIGRLYSSRFSQVLSRLFLPIFKDREKKSLSSTTIFLGVIFLCFLIFPKAVALTVVVYSIVGDVFSALVGRRWGRPFVFGRSLLGSFSFFLSSLISGLFLKNIIGVGLGFVVLGGVISTLTELFTPPFLDDNISVPLITGGFLCLLE